VNKWKKNLTCFSLIKTIFGSKRRQGSQYRKGGHCIQLEIRVDAHTNELTKDVKNGSILKSIDQQLSQFECLKIFCLGSIHGKSLGRKFNLVSQRGGQRSKMREKLPRNPC
jgi:hypothetical protein